MAMATSTMMSMTPIRREAIVVAIAVAAVFALASYGVSADESPSPTPSSASMAPSPGAAAGNNICFNAVLNMSDCLTYVEDGSKQRKPDKACCPELAGLVESNPICLCQLLANPDAITMGIKIDLKRAVDLPKVCGVSTPPLSTCSVAGVPVSLPPDEALSPGAGASPSPEGEAGSPSGIAAATPSPGNHANGLSSPSSSIFTFIFTLGFPTFLIIFS